MAINLNDNIRINAGKPSEWRFLNTENTVYDSPAAVCVAIPIPLRYVGLTVLVKSGSTNLEYWFRDDVNNLVLKTKDIDIPQGDFITGVTNIGYFSGKTGIQILPIDHISNSYYDGNYVSLYNYYYRGCDQRICIGAPSDDIPKRGYLKTDGSVSWIWNDYEGVGVLKGWIFVNGDVRNLLGQCPSVTTYYNGVTSFPYTAHSWTTYCNNGSLVSISTPLGSLNTGTTITIGGRPFNVAEHHNLHFRTVISDTPNLIRVYDDNTFIHVSGVSAVINGVNVGTGARVFSGKTNDLLYFRTLRASGDTIITEKNNEIIIFAGLSGQTSITGATTIGLPEPSGGTSIFAGKDNKTLLFNNIVGSGDTVVSKSGNTVVIYTDAGSEYYSGESPAVCTIGGISAGYVLTGKTISCILQDMFVPELFPTLTPPSTTTYLYSGTTQLSNNSLFEVNCNIGVIRVCSVFNRGSINPQYCSDSPYRAGNANCYVFTGADVAGSYSSTDTSMYLDTTSYTIQICNNTWGSKTCYDEGVQPKGSKGTNYSTPLPAGVTTESTKTLIGVYPIFATTQSITTLTKQSLYNMWTANNIELCLCGELGGYKQKIEIPCAWLGSPVNRCLCGICQFNTVSGQWEYPGGSAANSLLLWTSSSATETIQGYIVGYCQYTHNGTDRDCVRIRLVFS